MQALLNKSIFFLFALLAILIGLYPIIYLLESEPFGLLLTKSPELLQSTFWNIGFYGHISFGGLALLVGWSQFSKRLRNKYLSTHRVLGKTYLIAVLISGICAIYIGVHATGGAITSTGFIGLGLVWISTTLMAYREIINGRVTKHQNWMTYSYAACFAAVTLRIWLPILSSALGEFESAYKIVAWLCWVPNMLVAHWIVLVQRRKSTFA